MRTQVKLTGNVKLTVTSNQKLYLNAIEANATLSNNRFQKFALNPNSRYSEDIYRFFKDIDSSIIFDTYRLYDDKSVQSDLRKQFEPQYWYGADRCSSNLYDESYKIFAPVWLTTKVPKYFVVFKNDGARSVQYKRNPILITGVRYSVYGTGYITYGRKNHWAGTTFVAGAATKYTIHGTTHVLLNDPDYEYDVATNPNNVVDSLITNSNIVAIFDLSENTNAGLYLRNHVNDPLFSNKHIGVDFQERMLYYNGVDIKSGVISSKGENADSFMNIEHSVIDFDDYVTNGFQRNGIISQNILNLEFLFDDKLSDKYTFNRYYGYYCDDIDTGNFHADKMFEPSGMYRNRFYGKDFLPKTFTIPVTDVEGIQIIPDKKTATGYLFPVSEVNLKPSYFYIKDKTGVIHKINNKKSKVSGDDSIYVLNDKSIDAANLFGVGEKSYEIKASLLLKAGKSSLDFNVDVEEFPVGYTLNVMRGGKWIGSIIADDLQNVTNEDIDEIRDDFVGTKPYGPGDSLSWYFYPTGTKDQIAKSMAGALNFILMRDHISAAYTDNKVILFYTNHGKSDNIRVTIESDNQEISYGSLVSSGGSKTAICRVKVDKDLPSDITVGSYVAVADGYCRIKDISNYLDEPTYDFDGTINGFKGFNSYKVITIIDDNRSPVISEGSISIYNKQILSIGVLSIQGIKDFDSSFYYSDYSKSYEDEYYKYYKVKPNELIPGETYLLYQSGFDNASAKITYVSGGSWVELESIIPDPLMQKYSDGKQFVPETNEYRIAGGNPVVILKKYVDNANKQDNELKEFVGFKLLTSSGDSKDFKNLDVELLQNKFDSIYRKDITEYNNLREVINPENAVRSKVVPSISKWVLEDGMNVRDIEYRLNLSKAFDVLNFSPSFHDENQNPSYFTHEWMYLSGIPGGMSDESLRNSTAYMGKLFDMSKLYDSITDYFSNYFTVDDILVEESDGNRLIEVRSQKRYTVFKDVYSGIFETFFRGVKLRLLSDSINYNDYKFSAVINFVKSNTSYPYDSDYPIRIKVVENRDFKNITISIDLLVDDYKIMRELMGGYGYGGYYGGLSIGVENLGYDKLQYSEYMYLYMMNDLRSYNATYDIFNYGIAYVLPFYQGIVYGVRIPKTTNMYGINKYGLLRFDKDKIRIFNLLGYNTIGDFNVLYGASDDAVIMMSDGVNSTITEVIQTHADGSGEEMDDLRVNTKGLYLKYIKDYDIVGSFEPITFNTSIEKLSNFKWIYEQGGKDAYKDIANMISFASIVKLIETKSDYIEYTTYSDGVVTSGCDFLFDFINPSKIIVNKTLSASTSIVPEIEAPVSNEVVSDTPFVMFRYDGDYVPKFIDVIRFKNDFLSMQWGLHDSIWKNSPNDWEEFNIESPDDNALPKSRMLCNLNTKFDINQPDFGAIKDLFYHKVANNPNILQFDPIYESINGLAIDRKDQSILLSDFDAKFLRRNISKDNYLDVYGYESLNESKSFIGTKILNVEDPIIVYDFTSVLQTNADISLKNYNIGSNELVYRYIDSTKIPSSRRKQKTMTIRLGLRSMLLSYLSGKSSLEFQRYVNIDILGGDPLQVAKNYVNANIINLYKISSIVVSVKKSNIVMPLIVSMDDFELIQNGYSIDTNVKTQKINDLEVLLTYSMQTEYNYSFGIKVTLEI